MISLLSASWWRWLINLSIFGLHDFRKFWDLTNSLKSSGLWRSDELGAAFARSQQQLHQGSEDSRCNARKLNLKKECLGNAIRRSTILNMCCCSTLQWVFRFGRATPLLFLCWFVHLHILRLLALGSLHCLDFNKGQSSLHSEEQAQEARNRTETYSWCQPQHLDSRYSEQQFLFSAISGLHFRVFSYLAVVGEHVLTFSANQSVPICEWVFSIHVQSRVITPNIGHPIRIP